MLQILPMSFKSTILAISIILPLFAFSDEKQSKCPFHFSSSAPQDAASFRKELRLKMRGVQDNFNLFRERLNAYYYQSSKLGAEEDIHFMKQRIETSIKLLQWSYKQRETRALPIRIFSKPLEAREDFLREYGEVLNTNIEQFQKMSVLIDKLKLDQDNSSVFQEMIGLYSEIQDLAMRAHYRF